MISIGEALSAIISNNQYLEHGLHYRLLNLSQVARFIRPMVEARTKKEVRPSAILMALSRLQAGLAAKTRKRESGLRIENIHVQTGLKLISLERTRENHEKIVALYAAVQKERGYITISEGISEIAIIISANHFALAERILKGRATVCCSDAAAVRVRFDEKYLQTPGLLFLILQQIAFQGVNLLEIASTRTEFIIYLKPEDVRLAFDTIYKRFSGR